MPLTPYNLATYYLLLTTYYLLLTTYYLLLTSQAGERLAQGIDDPQCTKSGVYWSWNGNAQQIAVNAKKAGAGGSGGEIFENEFSGMITDAVKGKLAYEYSMEAVKDYL